MKVARKPPPSWPWDRVDLSPAEISAVKAVANGSPLAWAAIHKLCGTGKNPFSAGGEDGPRATDFACGKLWVGNTLAAIRDLKLPPNRPINPDPHAVPTGAPPGVDENPPADED